MAEYVTVETKRAIVNEMAAWLEGRNFAVTLQDGADPQLAKVATQAWAEGYRRAIFELRWAAQPPTEIPDDISELEP